jgi:L-alanine-DL-glutamate epimerase-like enolase superfamily enzyme
LRIISVREKSVPLHSQIRNAVISFSEMTASVVVIETDVIRDGQPVRGYGFNSNGRYAQGGLLRERFIPRLVNAPARSLLDEERSNFDPFRINEILMRNEKPGGHGERSVAVAVLDMAIWDLVAKIGEKPLSYVIAERYGSGPPAKKVFTYAAGGYYYPERDLGALKAEIRGYLDAGYTVVKMKIGGAGLPEDLRRIEAALDVVGDGDRLAVDANARFGLAEAIEYADALEPYGLRWFEEPGDPLDFELHAEVARRYGQPLATGENLFSHQDVQNLSRYAGLRSNMDVLQMDPALSYGIVEYVRMISVLREYGWSPQRLIPHGGHQMALNIAAGVGLGGSESYPGVFQPFGGFADGSTIEDGYVELPGIPGIGFEAKAALYRVLKDVG